MCFRPLLLSAQSTLALFCAAALLGSGFTIPSHAQTLTIGSPNIATADPTVPRPPTKPCEVTLFTDVQFTDFNPRPFDYAPPASCPGPWQKVVLSLDYSINGTNQFDRSADIWLGDAIIYFGTTEEPSVVGASELTWHVERDLTDYSALFSQAQSGHADLGNVYNSQYNGIPTGSATLYFYPAVDRATLQPRPDLVVPIGSASLSSGQQLTAAVSLPTNIERAFLDVYPQGQSQTEEFWYSNLPDDLASTYGVGGNTAFREGQVTIDGQPAGIVPVFPWIFTGADGPWMWQPIPGVQTLAFEAYRVDLTPFAGLLDDGTQHTIAVGIYNVTSYFNTAANLLLYLDPHKGRLSGKVIANTLSLTPAVNVVEQYANNEGSVTVNVNRLYTIAGTLDTSHGEIKTQIDANIGYSNVQQLANTNTLFKQDVTQETTTDITTTRIQNGLPFVVREQRSYPLTFNTDGIVDSTGATTYTVEVNQDFRQQIGAGLARPFLLTAKRENHVKTSETLSYGASGNFLGGAQTGSPSQTYTYNDPLGACYSKTVTAQANKLSGFTSGNGCPFGVNNLPWLNLFSQFASRSAGATVSLLP